MKSNNKSVDKKNMYSKCPYTSRTETIIKFECVCESRYWAQYKRKNETLRLFQTCEGHVKTVPFYCLQNR